MNQDQSYQTTLADYDEDGNIIRKAKHESIQELTGRLWTKINDRELCVCDFNGTIFFAKRVNGRIYAYGREATCKWCNGTLEIRGNKVYCANGCGNYQGRLSHNLNDYLRWEGARSYTLRREIAKAQGLELEPHDTVTITYAPACKVDFIDDE